MKHLLLVLVSFAALAVSHGAAAQMGYGSTGAAAGDWEFGIGPVFIQSKDIDFKGGSTVHVDSTTGVKIRTAWYVSPDLAIGFNFGWAGTDFNATNVKQNGSTFLQNGHLDFSTLMFDAVYTFGQRPIKPLISAGLGWNWLNTNIASGPPQTGCWWDPWWGYICSGYQPTVGSNSFTYQLGAGLQFNLSRSFLVDLDYRYTWIQVSNANGTPGFSNVELLFIWRFPGSRYY
jgi:opacity protein-like surface antigen